MSELGLDDGMADIVVLGDGIPVRTHGPARCAGAPCPLHRPSHHPLRNAPLTWLPELQLMMRTCVHGHQHPDPDSMTYLVANLLAYASWHDCCEHGCCTAETGVPGSGTPAPAARAVIAGSTAAPAGADAPGDDLDDLDDLPEFQGSTPHA